MRNIAVALLIISLLSGCASTAPTPEKTVASEKAPEQTSAQAPALSNADVLLHDAYRAEQRQDLNAAVPLYNAAADQGNAKAHYELARIYAQGATGIEKNLPLANEHLIKASDLGNGEATRVLAWQYLRGAGVERNVDKATAYFEQAAKTSVRAQRELGMLLVNVYTVYSLNDLERGLKYLRQATASGDAESAFYVYKTITSNGPATSETDAAFVLAVQKGYPKALNLAGGIAMKKGKYEQASQIYLKAAMKDDPAAMYEYANNVLLKNFKSTERELEAYAWFSIAAEHNYMPAVEEMNAQKGLRLVLDRKEPGRLDSMIASTKQLIMPWQAN